MTDEERERYMDEVQDPPMHYDRSGQPISLRRWATLMEDRAYKTIAKTWVGAYEVSTVWLGIDMSFGWMGRDGHPLQFETMVFSRGGPARDLEQERYTSEADARLGHERYVQLVQALEEIERA